MINFTVRKVFSDNAILQSGVENIIYGTAEPGAEVTGTISDDTQSTDIGKAAADDKGVWAVTLPAFPASFRPYTLKFTCGNDTVTAENVLFGEVFHISGQSNMELPINRTISPFEPHLPNENKYIREFRMSVISCFTPGEEYSDFKDGCWTAAEGAALLDQSGAGHYFAEELFRKYNVPIGLVNTAAGGAPVEARMPCEMLRELGGYDEFLDKVTVPNYIEDTTAADTRSMNDWIGKMDAEDTVSEGIFERTEGFTECEIPFYLRNDPNLKDFSGRIWFKKKFIIPYSTPIEDPMIILGAMIDADIVYINGVKVGETDYMYPPRNYKVPEGVLHYGENTVYVRLEVHGGNGGFVWGKRYCLKMGENEIELSGKWDYIIAARAEKLPPAVFFQGLPLSMYAYLTAPAFDIRFAGLIWYQAESNGDFERYPFLFKEFVEFYRRRCGYNIPVIFAQLPNFDDPMGGMPPTAWADLREAQRKCLSIPGTAMAVTIDTGESNDLHPLNKWDVGKRLAYCAERLIYSDTSAPKGSEPVKAAITEDGEIKVTFTNAAKLTSDHSPLRAFEIVYKKDDKEVTDEVTAVLDGDGVKLAYDEHLTPCAVRYLYENDPQHIDLYSEGLPVTPFKIDIE